MGIHTPTLRLHLLSATAAATAASLLFLCFVGKGHAIATNSSPPTEGITRKLDTRYFSLQITSLLPSTVCSRSSSSKGSTNGTSLTLVHKHGPCSQLARASSSAPTAAQVLAQDQSRVHSIHYRLSKQPFRDSKQSGSAALPAKSGSNIGSANYIVTVGLGTPKKDLSLIFDTGSDLTWTQCQPCVKSCYQQQDPIFNPSESASYSNITCDSAQCSKLASGTGNSPGCSSYTCLYIIQYGDQSFSVGFFGKEKLYLAPSAVFDGFLFGCGENNQGLFGGAAGLLGLGRDEISIVFQTAREYGKIFSYCLPSTPSSAGYLKFGKGGISSGTKFTPLLTRSMGASFYFLDMTAISVGGMRLPIPASVFSSAGTIIDSGTVISRLPPAAYAALRAEFRRQMLKYPMTRALSILDTCYDLSNYETVTVPKVSLFFGGGVEVAVDSSGILLAGSPSQVCLAFAANQNADDIAIFGNVQQQKLEVVYDVGQGKIGFGPGGCA